MGSAWLVFAVGPFHVPDPCLGWGYKGAGLPLEGGACYFEDLMVS